MGSYMEFRSFGDGTQVDGNGGRSQGSNFPLARQSSIYSLTFDELQTNFSGFGKDFGSMNMDELLKNIWTAEEAQVNNTSASCSSAAMAGPAVGCVGALQKQGSLTLPRTLSQKTVDQVWKDLYSEGPKVADSVTFQPGQPTLGEMTLEEFLLKAGVVREDHQHPRVTNRVPVDKLSDYGFGAVNPPDGIPLGVGVIGPSQLGRAQTQARHPLFPKPANVTFSSPRRSNHSHLPSIAPKSVMIGMADTYSNYKHYSGAGTGTGMACSMKKMAQDAWERNSEDSSSLGPSPHGCSPVTRGRRGGAGMERAVERRHRRMIKNRESAARSRARKQAYTLELETEIAKLREVNEELHKKQDEMMEIQKDEMIQKMRLQWGRKRVCLRRTLTGPW
uniref:BZIP domain-containing protein n=1 Tax=Kalanchoe fedtschenkoi TaxID=63787 RepID=A0A7N0T3P0_KALFE